MECTHTRTYIPSRYEEQQFDLAKRFDSIADDDVRRNTIIDYLILDENLNQSFLWTDRVSDRMKYPLKYASSSVYDDIDILYLSRFNVTRKCHKQPSMTWIEWIEPLSIHARHPFSLVGACPIVNSRSKAIGNSVHSNTIYQTPMQSVDHLLLLHRQHEHGRANKHMGRHRSYLFDAGTSTFQSSFWWFTCIYLQHNISFDQIFGWEMTLLKPDDFWEEVPSALRSRYHFYNAPVSANISHGNSVLRMIREIAYEHDYVAFKLDIDTPDVEIAIALEMLQNVEVRNLIDEFFWEFHFRCDIMMYCGWGNDMRPMINGLNLSSRADAMHLFRRYRLHGIRSHFWP